MNLPMQFQGYCWPNNPYEITVQYTRAVQEQQQPGCRSVVQNMGRRCRVIAGKGIFLGAGCREQFDRLAALLEQGGEGLLTLPGEAPLRAVFASLKLTGESRPNQLGYSFQFYEVPGGRVAEGGGCYRVAREGETLWHVAMLCGVPVDELRVLNRVQWPNALPVGTRLVLP